MHWGCIGMASVIVVAGLTWQVLPLVASVVVYYFFRIISIQKTKKKTKRSTGYAWAWPALSLLLGLMWRVLVSVASAVIIS